MEFLAINVVAAILKVTPQTVRSWCRRGLLGVRIGGRWRITQDDLEKFVIDGRRGRADG